MTDKNSLGRDRWVVGFDEEPTAKKRLDTKTILRALRSKKIDPDLYDRLFEDLEDQIEKCEKQIEMTEDSVLVYHLQRAPTRRTWYINVGRYRADKVKEILGDFRDEYVRKTEIGKPFTGSNDITEEVFLPLYADNAEQGRVEHHDIQTTWDGSALLETFYTKHARLLSLYGRLHVAVTKQNHSEIIEIICGLGPD